MESSTIFLIATLGISLLIGSLWFLGAPTGYTAWRTRWRRWRELREHGLYIGNRIRHEGTSNVPYVACGYCRHSSLYHLYKREPLPVPIGGVDMETYHERVVARVCARCCHITSVHTDHKELTLEQLVPSRIAPPVRVETLEELKEQKLKLQTRIDLIEAEEMSEALDQDPYRDKLGTATKGES